MSLTIQQARDLQTICAWVADLGLWEHPGGPDAEPPVAEALVRLHQQAYDRLRDTGQSRGRAPGDYAAAPAIQAMRGEPDGGGVR
jgi:hypothetical protein